MELWSKGPTGLWQIADHVIINPRSVPFHRKNEVLEAKVKASSRRSNNKKKQSGHSTNNGAWTVLWIIKLCYTDKIQSNIGRLKRPVGAKLSLHFYCTFFLTQVELCKLRSQKKTFFSFWSILSISLDSSFKILHYHPERLKFLALSYWLPVWSTFLIKNLTSHIPFYHFGNLIYPS